MADSLPINDRLIRELNGLPAAPVSSHNPVKAKSQSFAEALKLAENASGGLLKFSAHAQTRLQSRHISLGASDMQRIEGAVQKAAGKGAKESLVLLDHTAFVISIPNRTVITVVDKDNLKQNVFTNIDSAVIA